MKTERNTEKGLALVELMIALVLGLLVTGAAVSIYLSNRQAFRTAENMARLQENARFAFETLTREIREAGGNPCGARLVENVVNNYGGLWWAWQNGPIRGYDGNLVGPRVFGVKSSYRVNDTDGILLLSSNLLEGVIITKHDPNNQNRPQFTVNTGNHDIHANDIVMACDSVSAAIFQVTGVKKATLSYNGGIQKTFASGGTISKYSASFWYIGNNPRGGRSLYRLGFTGNPTDPNSQPVGQTEEVAEGVTDMQIEYLLRDASGNFETAYKTASSISDADWSRVVAVRVQLTLETLNKVGVNNQSIKRTFTHVTGIRNRLE